MPGGNFWKSLDQLTEAVIWLVNRPREEARQRRKLLGLCHYCGDRD